MNENIEPQGKSGSPPEQPTAPHEADARRLVRSRKDRMVAGVAGGIGLYFGIDPVLVRLAFVVLTIAGGSGILFYIIGWIAMPEATEEQELALGTAPQFGIGNGSGGVFVGGALVLIGAMILFRQIIPWFNDQVFWAVALIAAGTAVVLHATARKVAQ